MQYIPSVKSGKPAMARGKNAPRAGSAKPVVGSQGSAASAYRCKGSGALKMYRGTKKV